ncbi:MAG: DJ-1/PfpI family protein [Planctomycetaceae bacterium]
MNDKPLEGYRVLIFVGEDYEDLELWYPKLRLEEAAAHVTLAGEEAGKSYSGKHGYPAVSDALIDDMESADFHGVVCAGGWMPDKLRRNPKVLLLQEFDQSGK